MLNIKTLIATATKAIADTGLLAEIAKWKEIFLSNFGSKKEDEFKAGDEGFYMLLTHEQHELVAGVMVEKPSLFCRAKILGAFFQGKSMENVEGGKPVQRTYPKATGPVAIKAAEAVSAVLITNLTEVMARYVGGVDFRFWITDPGHTKYDANITGGKDAQIASGYMHCLLNIVDGLGDVETVKELREWFRAGFGNLPPGVYNRVKDEAIGNTNHLVGDNSQPVGRQGFPEQKYAKPQGGDSTPEKPLKGTGPKKARAAKKTTADVNPMGAMRPTAEDESLLAEYKAANNGNQPSNTALAVLASV